MATCLIAEVEISWHLKSHLFPKNVKFNIKTYTSGRLTYLTLCCNPRAKCSILLLILNGADHAVMTSASFNMSIHTSNIKLWTSVPTALG